MELGGQMLANRQQYEALKEQMQHIEAVIKMLDPAYNLSGMALKRRKPNQWFKRGAIYRRAVDVLRDATEAMTAIDLAHAVIRLNGIEDATKEDVQAIGLAIRHGLKANEGIGVERVGEGIPGKWQLIAQ
jgi:hypothetical protein